MNIHPGEFVIGAMMAAFAVLGLVMAANALDLEIEIFGLSLLAFSVLFIVGQIRRHFDGEEAKARVGAQTGTAYHG